MPEMLDLRPAVVGIALLSVLTLLLETKDGIGSPDRERFLAQPSSATGTTFSLPSDHRTRKKFEAARDHVRARLWHEAVDLLQALLDTPEDQFLPPARLPAQPGGHVDRSSLRTAAAQLLGSLPPAALEIYEARFGPQARRLLKDAFSNDDRSLLAQLVQRYQYTNAGLEAAAFLGWHYLDRGHPGLAAGYYTIVLNHPEADRLPPSNLFKAALAFHRAGHQKECQQAWIRLKTQVPEGLWLGTRHVDLDRLRSEWERLPAELPTPTTWSVFRSDPARTAGGEGDLPLLQPLWKVDTLDSFTARTFFGSIENVLQGLGGFRSPWNFPIATSNKVVCRSYAGIQAFDAATGHPLWHVPSRLSLTSIARAPGRLVILRDWLGSQPHCLLENTALGCLSTDGQRVYALEDLPIPPPRRIVQQIQGGALRPYATFKDSLFVNSLRALDLDSGAVDWEKGGPGQGELQNSIFLGAPLPLGHLLYGLVEKGGELRLFCLQPRDGGVVWTQKLAYLSEPVLVNPYRRTRGLHLASNAGLLICPTDAGVILAVNVLTRSLAWAYLYASKGQPQDSPASPEGWHVSAPVITAGKVLLTPTDADQVFCLNLRDGSPAWQADRQELLYLAGAFRNKVLLVGQDSVQALHLANGQRAWTQSVGVPCGQGAASGQTYYLPLAAEHQTGGPGVLALDIDTGRVRTVSQSAGVEKLGNLSWTQQSLISQTMNSIAVYPYLKTRLDLVEQRLAQKPGDVSLLGERGLLRLSQGNVSGACEDLQGALRHTAPAQRHLRGPSQWHEGLRQAVQRDFANGEKYLAKLTVSCQVPGPETATAEEQEMPAAEQRRRQANYLLLLARGHEQQGRPVEALRAYSKLYACIDQVPGSWSGETVGWRETRRHADTQTRRHGDEGLFLSPCLRVSVSPCLPMVAPQPGRWICGRVATLIEAAAPAQRPEINREIARQWQQIKENNDPEELERFVALFGKAKPFGLEARLTYAERLADRVPARFLEIELQLLAGQRQRDDRGAAARATELLARLLTRNGEIQDALYYYRILGKEFAQVPLRDGRTGAQVLSDIHFDKRFIPWLNDPGMVRTSRPTEEGGVSVAGARVVNLVPSGEVPPVLCRQRLVLDVAAGQIKLVDRASGTPLWAQDVSLGALRTRLATHMPPNGSLPCRAEGHLALVGLGQTIYGIDLKRRQLLWQCAPFGKQFESNRDMDSGSDSSPVDDLSGPDAILIGPVAPDVFSVLRANLMIGLHPLRGEILWCQVVRRQRT
jgi:outer membrane protein assembly factor BamB